MKLLFSASWDRLKIPLSNWKLISFKQIAPPSWDEYWAGEREYWGADNRDKSRVQYYFGKTRTEENLLAKSKKKYQEYIDHLLHWNGLCRIGEIVKVIRVESDVIVLSKNWKGQVSDHSDLEIWLKDERVLFFKHARFCCELYSFGTIVNPPRSIQVAMGEKVGSWRVSHRIGRLEDRNKTIRFSFEKKTIEIGDAIFQLID